MAFIVCESIEFIKVIGPQQMDQLECQCMIGLGASVGGEAGWGGAAARAGT